MAPPPSAIDVVGLTDTQAITLPDPLSINGVSARRAKAGKLSWGTAAYTTSDFYKTPSHGKPKAKRWDYRLSEETLSRGGSSLKGLLKHLGPGVISLGGGLPSSDYFPFEHLDIKVPLAPHFSEEETRDSGTVLTVGKHDVAEGKGHYDLGIALNYGQGTGSAQMLRFVTEHTEIVHDPPYRDWQCCLTVGSTSALDMAFRMFTQRGDTILSEEYTFSTAVETAAPMGIKIAGVKMDAEGLLPDDMDELLTNWDESARGASKPWLLYTVPSGQNPTGATQGAERRRRIYAVAQKHDLYILEDEPYYFLQMQPYTGLSASPVPPPESHDAFLKSLIPSLLSMDTDGRVMRMDSFSKVISPGARVGWITASEQVVERFVAHNNVSIQTPSGISQLVLHKLLDEHWGHAGYLDWLMYLRLEYTQRRDAILHACETHLPADVVRWNPPVAGMFLWLQIDWRKHPHATTWDMADIEEEIFQACVSRAVLVARGSWFCAQKDVPHPFMFFRVTFAAAPADKMVEAIKRVGDALRETFYVE
ncbi:MAG: Aromatic/aminoadipate aminotransferase 1 [Piccolia ochrophora]|nr:MAG: Aromatic/aminoadipate aminotransferase 1 [Piccolia ochrophora]